MGAKGKNLGNKAAIKAIAVEVPSNLIKTSEVVSRIYYQNPVVQNGSLERYLGNGTRFYADEATQVSDLASEAARRILNQNPGLQIDLLIFAAASSDLIEPATANIIQTKLGVVCPVMDIKNACNSFTSAMQVASAFIENGVYQNVLIVNGEKLSEVINFNPKSDQQLDRSLAAYGLGDAGAAMLMGRSEDRQIVYQKFCSWGEHWDVCTVEGGGSRAFRKPEKYYFESDSRALRKVFLQKIPSFIYESLKEANWEANTIDCLISHQVSATTTTDIAACLGIPFDRCINTFSKYGNTAAATIPLALHEALESGRIQKGNRVCIMGLAAGVSLSVQLIEW